MSGRDMAAMRVLPRANRIAFPLALIGGGVLLISPVGGLTLLIFSFTIRLFLRDPGREPPASGIVAPADGKVSVIREEEGRVRLGIYMSALDVHVNRAPLTGLITEVVHRPGANRPAFSKDSDRNERVQLEIDTDHGSFSVVLIAGWFARRIVPFVSSGDWITRGERIGFISFGSRADVVFPPEIETNDLCVSCGDRVRAGETVLAFEATFPNETAASPNR